MHKETDHKETNYEGDETRLFSRDKQTDRNDLSNYIRSSLPFRFFHNFRYKLASYADTILSVYRS